jgi:hypothetical protein
VRVSTIGSQPMLATAPSSYWYMARAPVLEKMEGDGFGEYGGGRWLECAERA